jgi:putative transposase
VKGKWARCVSDFAADFKGRSEKEIEIASHELRQRNKRHGQQFNINQKQLASLLRTADATEVLQMQRLHDSEVKSVLATIHGERVDKEEIDLSLPPTQSSAEKHPVSVLDAVIEVQKRPRKLKTYEDY